MKKKLSVLLMVIAVLALVSTVTYAYWNLSFQQNENNVVVTDCFRVTYEEDTSSNIHLERGYPIVEEEGRELKPYVFWMENICSSMAQYQINLESMESSTMPERVLKAKINDNKGVLLREETNPTVGVRAYKVSEGSLYPREKKRIEVRVWMDESTTMDDYDAMNKNYVGKVTVVSSYQKENETYYEEILNGTDPVLKDGLIPVTIDNDGTVKKADEKSAWYNYSNQKWANAVILNDETEEYQDGEEIPEEAIESYFVWIPRYKYKIWNMGKYETLTSVDYNQVHTIEVVFGVDTTIDSEYECRTPNQSGSDGTCSVGKYMTHPAFTAFDTESNVTKGIWVGKFETGYKDANSVTEAQKNENNPGAIQIKPNVYSWRGIQVANAYLSSYNYKKEYDSHMMKNTEWGAVAYLQHSKYGSRTSVRINNNISYKTGYGGVREPTCGYTGKNEECNEYGITDDITRPWNTEIGVLASTTGNISGVYDMSGGAWESVMGVMLDSTNTNPCSGRDSNFQSGFNGPYCGTTGLLTNGVTDFPPESKYYDVYLYNTSDKVYNRRIFGDATGEMGPFTINNISRQIGSWYDAESWFISSLNPWFLRGGDPASGFSSGVLTFYRERGFSYSWVGYRVVLTPQEG